MEEVGFPYGSLMAALRAGDLLPAASQNLFESTREQTDLLPLLHKIKKPPTRGHFLFYGGGGIRTHDTGLAYTRFPSVLLRPLGHSSKGRRHATLK